MDQAEAIEVCEEENTPKFEERYCDPSAKGLCESEAI